MCWQLAQRRPAGSPQRHYNRLKQTTVLQDEWLSSELDLSSGLQNVSYSATNQKITAEAGPSKNFLLVLGRKCTQLVRTYHPCLFTNPLLSVLLGLRILLAREAKTACWFDLYRASDQHPANIATKLRMLRHPQCPLTSPASC